MARKADGPACDFCQSGALYLVTRDVPGSPAAHACRGHVSVAVDKTAERTGGGSVSVYLLTGGSMLGGPDTVGDILELVRRLGAQSARDPDLALAMEDELYRAVLALIAQGAPGAASLATAALQSQAYHMDRRET
jgi:hypothetical protein